MFERLETIRDEIKLQAHLFKEDVEHKAEQLNSRWSGVRLSTQKARRDVREATQLWAETVRDGYQKIKKTITRAMKSDHH